MPTVEETLQQLKQPFLLMKSSALQDDIDKTKDELEALSTQMEAFISESKTLKVAACNSIKTFLHGWYDTLPHLQNKFVISMEALLDKSEMFSQKQIDTVKRDCAKKIESGKREYAALLDTHTTLNGSYESLQATSIKKEAELASEIAQLKTEIEELSAQLAVTNDEAEALDDQLKKKKTASILRGPRRNFDDEVPKVKDPNGEGGTPPGGGGTRRRQRRRRGRKSRR